MCVYGTLVCLSVHIITSLLRLIENTGCGIMSVSHTPKPGLAENTGNVEIEAAQCAPCSTLLSVLSSAWFGVWDTDTVLCKVCRAVYT